MRIQFGFRPPSGRPVSLAKNCAQHSWPTSGLQASTKPPSGETMSHRPFRLTFAAVLLIVASVLPACSPSKGPAAALSRPGGSGAARRPEWSQYTCTLRDNGGDGSEELAKVTGAFDDAPYKVKFARFDYGPPLVQAAATGDIDLGYVGTVPPITGAAKQFGFKIVA